MTLDQFIKASGYTSAQVNAIPGLSDSLQAKITAITSAQQGAPGQVPWNVLMTQAQKELSSAVSNPVSYVENQYLQQATNYAQQAYLGQLTPAFESSATNFFGQANQFLQQNGISTSQIASISDQALAAGEQSAQDYLKGQQANAQFGQIFTLIADAAALIAEQPELIPLINGAGALISGDSLAKAIEVAAVSYITQQSTGPIQQYFQNTLGLNAATAKALSNAVANTVGTAVTDPKQVVNALTSGLLTSMVTATTSQIPDFNKLSNAAQQTVNTSITDFIKSSTGKGLSTQDLLSQAISIGTTAGIDALHNETATNAGYPDYKTYQAAQQGGFSSFQDYQQATALGFSTQASFDTAKSEGFTNATDYKAATTAGFNNANDYKQAQQLGINNGQQYNQYQDLIKNGATSDFALQTINAVNDPNSTYGQLLNLFTQEQGGTSHFGPAGAPTAGLTDVPGSAPPENILGINNNAQNLQDLMSFLQTEAAYTDSGITKNSDGTYSITDLENQKSYTIDAKGNLISVQPAFQVSGASVDNSQSVKVLLDLINNNVNSGLGFVGLNFSNLNSVDLQNAAKILADFSGTTGSGSTGGLANLGISLIGTADNGTPIYQLNNGVAFVLATVGGQIQPQTVDLNKVSWVEYQQPQPITLPSESGTQPTNPPAPPSSPAPPSPSPTPAPSPAPTPSPSPSGGGGGGGGGNSGSPGGSGSSGEPGGSGSPAPSPSPTSPTSGPIIGTDPVTGLPITGNPIGGLPVGSGGNPITGGTDNGGSGSSPGSGSGGGSSGGGSSPGTGTGGEGSGGGGSQSGSGAGSGGSSSGGGAGGSGSGTGGGTGSGTGGGTGSGTGAGTGGGTGGGSGGGNGTGTGTGSGDGSGTGTGDDPISGGGPLFIPPKYSALAQALSVAPPQTGITQGLTSGGEGGEIQSLETGKTRRNVWNESSLRLRDALGLE